MAVCRVGPGIKPPKLLKKVEPTYTSQARAALVQGSAVFSIVIDTNGQASSISVLSPLGFGLDEQAEEAIRKWRFKPGEKDGHLVKIRAVVQVNFRFSNAWFDEKAERRRTSFNIALADVNGKDAERKERAAQTIRNLASEDYAPAMFVEASLLRDGTAGTKDLGESSKLMRAAAEQNYGPAMYEVGRMYIAGQGVPVDREKGLQLMRDAAVLGSAAAQLDLGLRYEAGTGVPREIDRARRYFRLCAAARQSACQFHLGRLLISDPQRLEHNYIQGLAWLELASEHGTVEADGILKEERPKLTDEQKSWVESLKKQLIARDEVR